MKPDVDIVGFHCCDNTKHPLLGNVLSEDLKNSWFLSEEKQHFLFILALNSTVCTLHLRARRRARRKTGLRNAHFCNRPHCIWYKCGWGNVTVRASLIQPHFQRKRTSVAAAGPHHHVLVFLQYDVGVVVEVQHWDGVELGGGATRLWHVLWVHQVHLKVKEKEKTIV